MGPIVTLYPTYFASHSATPPRFLAWRAEKAKFGVRLSGLMVKLLDSMMHSLSILSPRGQQTTVALYSGFTARFSRNSESTMWAGPLALMALPPP